MEAVIPIASAAIGGLTSRGGSSGGSQTTTQQIDPRMAALLFGDNSTTRRLKPGVKPIYSGVTSGPNGEPLVDSANPTITGKGYIDQDGNWVPVSGVGEMINPETDYETVQGNQGLYNLAQGIYQNNIANGYLGLTPEMQTINNTQLGDLTNLYNSGYLQSILGNAADITAGQYDAVRGPVRDVSPYFFSDAEIRGNAVDPQSVYAPIARKQQGDLDPTKTLKGLLSGAVDTTALDALQKAATNRAMVGYGDAITDAGRMFSEQIAPNIRSNAIANGQYGGTRQGIAEGIAARGLQEQLARNARDLGLASMDQGTQLYSNAYRDSKSKQAQVASDLNSQALGLAEANANRDLTGQQFNSAQRADIWNRQADRDLAAQQFNSNNDFRNNQQSLDFATNRVNNQMSGYNLANGLLGMYNGMMDTGYNTATRAQTNAQNAQNFPWAQLQNYSSILQPGAQLNSSTNTTTTQPGANPWASALGGGLLGYQAYKSFQQPSYNTGSFFGSSGGGWGSPSGLNYGNYSGLLL